MSKQKYYAVRVGRKKGIYNTWDECHIQVDGYPNAQYKSFKTIKEAEMYLENKDVPIIKEKKKTTKPKVNITNAYIEGILRNSAESTVNAFVDGSYDKANEKYSYGAYIILKDDRLSFMQVFDDEEGLKYNNFSGEIKGAMMAVRWAIDNGYKKIHLFYDYEGIEKFATGEYKKTNNPISEEYKKFILEAKRKIWIQFFKITSHTNITYNDKADQLAKDALK